MTDPVAAMATWVGALSRGGLLLAHAEEEGAELAFAVLGKDGLVQMRRWFAAQPGDVIERERRGAIHACIWMAQADREVATEEIELLESILSGSDLPTKVREELVTAIEEPLEPEDIAEDLTQPGLRQLVLALAAQIAQSDNRFDEQELAAYDELAEAFSIEGDRATQIREAIADL